MYNTIIKLKIEDKQLKTGRGTQTKRIKPQRDVAT
jgi:hypothetical protein